MKKIIITTLLTLQLIGYAHAMSIADLKAMAAQEAAQEKQKFSLRDFKVTDMNGEIHSSATLGGKSLILTFWASWSPSSEMSIENLSKFAETNREEINVIGMNYEFITQEDIVEFIDKKSLLFPNALLNPKNQSKFDLFEPISVIPTSFIFNKKGELVERHEGELTTKYLNEFID